MHSQESTNLVNVHHILREWIGIYSVFRRQKKSVCVCSVMCRTFTLLGEDLGFCSVLKTFFRKNTDSSLISASLIYILENWGWGEENNYFKKVSSLVAMAFVLVKGVDSCLHG